MRQSASITVADLLCRRCCGHPPRLLRVRSVEIAAIYGNWQDRTTYHLDNYATFNRTLRRMVSLTSVTKSDGALQNGAKHIAFFKSSTLGMRQPMFRLERSAKVAKTEMRLQMESCEVGRCPLTARSTPEKRSLSIQCQRSKSFAHKKRSGSGDSR